MIEKVLEPVVNAGRQLLLKAGGVLAKESVRKGAKFGGIFAALVFSNILTSVITSKWKDKVFDEFLKKHDKEMAQKLTEQFKSEMNDLKKQIADLKLDKEETKKRFRDGVIALCEKFGIDPNGILK
jgi:hypothetical protein